MPKPKKADIDTSPSTEKRKVMPARNRSPGRARPKSKSPSRVGRPPTREKSKSPARTKVEKPPPKKSPEKSAGVVTPTRRSPIRRSPGRSPGRSPARSSKSIDEKEQKTLPSLSQGSIAAAVKTRKHKIVIENESDSDTGIDDKPEIKEKPKAAVRGRTRIEVERDQVELRKEPSEDPSNSLFKRVTRSSQSKEVERIVHLRHFENVTKKLGEFSDDDELLIKQSRDGESSERKLPEEFGGTIGAGITALFCPVLVTYLLISCNEYQCKFGLPQNLKTYATIQTWFDLKAFLVYCSYFLIVALLSALPFGGKKISGLPNKHGKLTYVTNGLLSFVIVLSILIGLEIRNVPVTEYLIDHIRHLFTAGLVLSILVGAYAYVRSFYVPVSALNTHAIGKSGIYNFVLGREVNPRVLDVVDLKVFFYRMVIFGMLIMDFAFMYRSLGLTISKGDPQNVDLKSLNFQPTVLVYFVLHTLYALDGLIFEHAFITTMENQQEGLGFMFISGYLLYPIMSASAIRYIVDYGVQLEAWKLALIVLVNLVGYVLYRGSNNQKDAFRRNPYSPKFAHLEAIPTTQGKKLLCSGFWGLVRHPNYLGDILIMLSFVPFVLTVPPVLVYLMSIVLLVHRTRRDHNKCKQKYSAAWDRYCSRVKYVLVPKVY